MMDTFLVFTGIRLSIRKRGDPLDIQSRTIYADTYFLFIADYVCPEIESLTFVDISRCPPNLPIVHNTLLLSQDPPECPRGPSCPLFAGLPGGILRHRDEGQRLQPRLPPLGPWLRRLDDKLPGKQILKKPHGG